MRDIVQYYILIAICVFIRDLYKYDLVCRKYGKSPYCDRYFYAQIIPGAAFVGVFWPISLGYFLITGQEL